ncbi:GPCR kinase [Tanacetum coccineum]|uniref:GPCR kinase n=1 Tax=Tanacetum coccineum TaxID=301880 RepID=A0ABQ4ZC30_9ASTR
MKKFVEDVGEDEDFKSGSWISVTDYVKANGSTMSGCLGDINNFLINGKLDQVVAIVKSCSPNVLGDLTVTMKDLSSTVPGTTHHKVIGEGGYGKDITVGAALILANVSGFTPKPSMHYLNITMKNVVKVFRKDTIPGSGSVIIEQRVKVNQKAHILELKRRNHEEHCSDNLYVVSIKEDTAYPCPKLHSASTKRRSIHRIQMKPYAVFKYKS